MTRVVVLTRRYALKLPRFDRGWRAGLIGLLANLQEAEFGSLGWHELCPVLLALPGGWLVVMPRAEPLSRSAFAGLREVYRSRCPGMVELKRDSFGVYDGRVVAVDYGS